ncbi:type III PLP-dependent enzyme [Actinomadura vinacea]|uniref:ornithine decarboxylase n=1 Tax=Actinomadura vinacea TaxID=115336 RepID=A0ABN3K9U1_9ACTN
MTDETGGHARIRRFLDEHAPASPCLVIDLETVRDRYRALAGSWPEADLLYAVKANPAPEVVGLLARSGAGFDVASPGEVALCLAEGARPESLSYGNTIKKRADIEYAHSMGVRTFTTDSLQDLENIAAAAPGSSVFCRILLEDTGALTPFRGKFGCSPETAVRLLQRAAELGLRAGGVSFHVGSQQLDPRAWDAGIAEAATVTAKLAAAGTVLDALNIGGGLPGRYTQRTPPLRDYVAAIAESIDRHFGPMGADAGTPRLVLEPGRFIVGDAGLLQTEVVLVADRGPADGRRWVYLDVGRYNGLAEAEGEAITYRIASPDKDGPPGPVILAGPTCDGDDIIYQRNVYHLPTDLGPGDRLHILNAGAYTASYSSVGFNGFPPLPTHCIDHRTDTGLRGSV